MEQDLKVNDAKPGIVHVYDYYDKGESSLCSECVRTAAQTQHVNSE